MSAPPLLLEFEDEFALAEFMLNNPRCWIPREQMPSDTLKRGIRHTEAWR
jgi:hypothetical protein